MRKAQQRADRSPVMIFVGAIGLALLAGCSDAGGEDGSPGALFPSEPPPPQGAVVAEIIAHLSPSRGTITFEPIERASPGLDTQSMDSLNLVQDDVPGSGLPTTVELITNSVGYNAECPAPYQTNTFCGNVTLQSFYGRSLSNVFVQATSITPPTGHNGLNKDSSEFGLDDTYGLWKYTSPAASTEGVVGQSPHNTGTRDWVFANPDNAETSIVLRVVSSLRYSGYVFDFSSASFIDACSGGVSTTASSAQQTMPFPFTLYQSTNSVVRFNIKGMITFGNVNGTASGSNVSLPAATAPKPGVFVFWDNLKYGPGGKMCYKVVGSAPNRQAVITWNNMTFTDAPDANTASLQFGAILTEGTNNIDVVYNAMSGASSRPDGDSATIGVQNEAGSVATAEFNSGGYGSGNAYAFVPIP
jgi:hypothetical protein